jgi:sec-independent protein translocase protein TatC
MTHPPEDLLSDTKAPLIVHLIELKKRLTITAIFFFIAFAVCYYYAGEIYNFLVRPLADIYAGEANRRLIYTGLTEAFFTYVQVALYAALFISFPVIASQIYIFLAPGLYRNERRVLLPFLIAAPILFLLGAALVYYFIFPMAWQFFASFEHMGGDEMLPIQLEARVGEYLSLVMQLIFAFGLAFQLPIVLTLLSKVGIITADDLKKARKYAIVAIFTVAAILTPPDVISQIGLAVPLYLLYELSILACNKAKDDGRQTTD